MPKRIKKPAKKPDVNCDVCGISLAPPPSANVSYDGAWRYTFGCGDWECANILKLRPELRNPKKLRYNQKDWGKAQITRPGNYFPDAHLPEQKKNVVIKKWKNCEIDGELLKRIHAHTPTDERWWKPGVKDVRGTEASAMAQQSPWATLSRQKIAMRFIDSMGGAVALELCRRSKETTKDAFVRLFFGGDRQFAMLFDAILIWRCSCPLKTQIIYETLDDLPQNKGYFGICQCCGGVALEVVK